MGPLSETERCAGEVLGAGPWSVPAWARRRGVARSVGVDVALVGGRKPEARPAFRRTVPDPRR